MSDPNKHHIVINGKRYSATTGQILLQDVIPMAHKKKAGPTKIDVTDLDRSEAHPVEVSEHTQKLVTHSAVRTRPVHAQTVHTHTSRSQTLARKYVKKPAAASKAVKIA